MQPEHVSGKQRCGHLGDAGGRHAGSLLKMLMFASDTFLFLDCTNMHMCVLQHFVYVIIRLLSPFTLESGFLVGESFQLVVALSHQQVAGEPAQPSP